MRSNEEFQRMASTRMFCAWAIACVGAFSTCWVAPDMGQHEATFQVLVGVAWLVVCGAVGLHLVSKEVGR